MNLLENSVQVLSRAVIEGGARINYASGIVFQRLNPLGATWDQTERNVIEKGMELNQAPVFAVTDVFLELRAKKRGFSLNDGRFYPVKKGQRIVGVAMVDGNPQTPVVIKEI